MIRGIITDIDGVMVGDRIGLNSPYPHPDVIAKLQHIHAKNIPVILCSGKPHYAIGKIITDCTLNNPHITDGGAIIIDPITHTIIKKHVIAPPIVAAMVGAYVANTMYVEIYTQDGYIIQKNQIREPLTSLHTHILQTPPSIVNDLVAESASHEIIKIVPIANNESDAHRMLEIFRPFNEKLTLARSVHPIALPHQFAMITNIGVSKHQSAIDATAAIGVPLSDFLGIGDSTSDWSFMELCGYAAAVGNASEELKKLVLSKGSDRGFIGPSVDENGMLTVLDHFIPQFP